MLLPIHGLFAPLAGVNALPSQAMAEYVGIAAQNAAQKFQVLVGDASRWLQDHPLVLWGGLALMVLMWWATRARSP